MNTLKLSICGILYLSINNDSKERENWWSHLVHNREVVDDIGPLFFLYLSSRILFLKSRYILIIYLTPRKEQLVHSTEI